MRIAPSACRLVWIAAALTLLSGAAAALAETQLARAAAPVQTPLARDEGVVANINGNCAAFEHDGCAPLFAVASAPNGPGGPLYAIELKQTTGDGCSRGTVYFFDGVVLLYSGGGLAPGLGRIPGSGQAYVSATNGVYSPGPSEVAVRFVVSKPNLPHGHVSCAADGNAGTDAYVYRSSGALLQLVSGHAPAPPEVIGLGTT